MTNPLYESENSGQDTTSTKSMKDLPEKSILIENDPMVISIIGSGDFGRGLALRMVQCGYKVCIGSRNPTGNTKPLVEKIGAKLMQTEDAINASKIIVMAVPKDFYVNQPLHLLEGKTVIDCSNRSSIHRKNDEQSQAEYLQSLLPKSPVVKAFNVLSAYALESGGLQGSKEVYFAGDDQSAKDEVKGLIQFLGFTPVDRGSLRNAREIEDIPVQRFPNWKYPFIVSWIVFLWFFLLGFGKFSICLSFKKENDGNGMHWDQSAFWKSLGEVPITNINRALACHALNMLALCYLPGCIAGYIQLYRGTKYSRFPKILDRWLKMRKYLGLLMLFSACIHACMSLADGHWRRENGWKHECFLATGITAFALAMILGITSLPSVTNILTWKEFGFVQSKLGWLSLCCGTAHDLFNGYNMTVGWDYFLGVKCNFFLHGGLYALWIPVLTLALKMPLVFPPVDWYLTKIRGGWTRGIPAEKSTIPEKSTKPEKDFTIFA